MDQKTYNLFWHSYSDHLKEMLHNMVKSDELTDVTLVCDDKKKLKAHKIVLRACLVFNIKKWNQSLNLCTREFLHFIERESMSL